MNKSKNNKEIWNKFYKKSSKYIYWPSEEIFTFSEKYLGDLKGKKVLDIGCGAGRHLLMFDYKGCITFGIDSSNEAVSTSKKFLKKWNVNSEIKLASSTNIPYNDNSFDIVILWGIFHYLSQKDQKKLLKKLQEYQKMVHGLYFPLDQKMILDIG